MPVKESFFLQMLLVLEEREEVTAKEEEASREDSVESSRRTVLRPVLRDRVFIGGARVARVPTVIQELIHN